MNTAMSLGIHGNSSYSDYKASFVSVPVLLLFVPALYIPITIRIVFRIFVNLKVAIREKNANVPLFSAITLSHVMCLLFFLADFLYLRLPLSGLLTSWCASLQPSGYLVILVIIVYHINYIVVILPFLVAVIRLMLVLSPQTHHKINSKVLKWARPIILLYPFNFTFGMFSKVGYCEYPGWPVDFGGVIFRVKHNGVGIQNKYGLLFNTVFWLLASLIINTILILKLVILKSFTQLTVSRASQRAQLSLTITSISMSLTCVTNGMIAVGGMLIPKLYVLLIVARPFINDLDTCLTPWIFYLTHPAFRKKSISPIAPNRRVLP